ncbi:MAG: flagellar hook-associated protein FlgL [Burkholderiales bacterium]
MRVSTSMLHDLAVRSMNDRTAELVRTQQQISTGRRLLTPSDDPVAASQALVVSQAKARTGQFLDNVGSARDSLGFTEATLAQATGLLQSVRDLAVAAGNAAYADENRASLAIDVRGRLAELATLANAVDGEGRYLFGGFRDQSAPFALVPGGAVYNGDTGRRELDVARSRSMPVRENGQDVFVAIADGNGTFRATAAATNTGSGVVGSLANAGPTGTSTYEVRFNVVGSVTTYDVWNATTSAYVTTGNPYQAGSAITVDGRQITIGGAPANGDLFTLAPSSTQSVFATLDRLAATLEAPVSGAGGRARLANDLNDALLGIDRALEQILSVRADVGARLREVDALASGHEESALQQQTTLSRLTDLDYASAVSTFSRQQVALEASQRTYAQMSRLSLFDYL